MQPEAYKLSAGLQKPLQPKKCNKSRMTGLPFGVCITRAAFGIFAVATGRAVTLPNGVYAIRAPPCRSKLSELLLEGLLF